MSGGAGESIVCVRTTTLCAGTTILYIMAEPTVVLRDSLKPFKA